jgi:hypothetical protein
VRNGFSTNWAIIVLLATSILFLSTSLSFAMTDVTDKVQLEETSWRKDHKTKTKYVDVSIKNTSQNVLWTPIIKVVIEDLSDSRITVANADGTTGDGKPFFEYAAPGRLGIGKSTDSKEWMFAFPKSKVKLGHKLSYTARVWGCTDADSDGYYLEADCGTAADCNDSAPLIKPDAEEICDQTDNNCDGQIDEGVTITYYVDEDGDGYGRSTITKEACSQPDHYVLNSDDCNDDDPYWWKSDSNGNCELSGYLDCSYPYEMYDKNCHPPVTDVVTKLAGLTEDHPNGVTFDKDYFSWRYQIRPGEALEDSSKTHLQSIQYTELKYPDEYERETERRLIVTMSDETNNHATVSLVWINNFASEDGYSDEVRDQSDLTWFPDIQDYNHAGGSQLIGEYLFVALEDFNGAQSDPRTGVWRIERGSDSVRYQYSFEVITGDAHHTAVGITKLSDETYLAAACVVKGCDTIRFFKSAGTSLSVDDSPLFVFVDEWERPNPMGWASCGDPQNINMVVDATGDIYVVMFGMKMIVDLIDLGIPCGTGEHDDHIYVYKLNKNGKDIGLEFMGFGDIDAGGNNCECITADFDWPPTQICRPCGFVCPIDLAASGTNFMAAAGLWIRPDGKDDIAILSTEHYDSCGIDSATGDGASRWGVTGNWKN